MLRVDHDKSILLSTPFPATPMLSTNCCRNVMLFYVGNKRCVLSHTLRSGITPISIFLILSTEM